MRNLGKEVNVKREITERDPKGNMVYVYNIGGSPKWNG